MNTNLLSFEDKVAINANQSIPEKNKITSQNVNDIKKAINIGLIELIYPVGSIIYNQSEDFDPNTAYGGTWEKIKGRMIIGYNEEDEDFNTLANTGGSKTHTQTVNEMPNHLHTYGRTGSATSGGYNSIFGSSAQTGGDTISSSKTGGGQAMNIMNPYYVANIWLRTA